MGFIAPAMPWIIKGGAALGGALFGKKAQKNAMARSPEEQLALQGAQQAATGLTQTGQSLLQSGQSSLGGATNYFQTLLRGSRPAMQQAVAAPTAAITDVYRGAERGLARSGVRGAARDVATSDLNRQQASQIAGLVTGMQPAAAQQLAGIGGSLIGQGAGLQQGAGGLWASLLGAGAQNRMYGRQEGAQAGGAVGNLIFDLIGGLGKRNTGISGNLPSRSTTPSWTSWLP